MKVISLMLQAKCIITYAFFQSHTRFQPVVQRANKNLFLKNLVRNSYKYIVYDSFSIALSNIFTAVSGFSLQTIIATIIAMIIKPTCHHFGNWISISLILIITNVFVYNNPKILNGYILFVYCKANN